MCAIAIPMVAALGQLVESQLFGITATNPFVIADATLLLGAASLAARLNPTEVLRLD